MRVAIVVNRLGEPVASTTSMVVATLEARGHEVVICGVEGLGLDAADNVTLGAERADAFDAVMIRTNPGRASDTVHHGVALELLARAVEAGVPVVNDPLGLRRAATKLYLSVVPPAYRPRTLVTRRREAIDRFIEEMDGPTVIKPIMGTRGQDVFKVGPGAPNLNAIVEAVLRSGWAMVQEFVPEAVDGDTRVLLLEGEPLRVGDEVAAIRRVPGEHDFRSNVHIGGRPAPGRFDERLAAIAAAVGPRMVADGLFLVGLDVIGAKVVEINVFSPGGLADGNAFEGVDFTVPIAEALEARAAR